METTNNNSHNNLEHRKEEEKYELLPPEGGWGYVVALSTAVMFIFTVVPMAAFGIIYGQFLRDLGDETSGTTNTNGMFNTVYSFTGLVANHMLAKMSCRKVTIIGAVLFFSGAVGIVFVNSLLQLIICFGVIQGFGFGLMMPAVFTAFNLYFDRRRALVMNIAQALMVAAIMVFPSFCKFLIDTYGFRGTIAVLAALSLNCIVAGQTCQPVKWHMKKRRLSVTETKFLVQEVTRELVNMKRHSMGKDVPMRSLSASVSKEHLNQGHNSPSLSQEILNAQIAPLLEENMKNMKYLVRPRRSIVSIGDRAASVSTLGHVDRKIDAENEKLSMWQSMVKTMELNLFTDPKYVNIVIGISMSITSDVVFISLIPLLLANAGHSSSEITFMMTIYFAFDLSSRIILSVLSSIVTIKSRYLFLLGSFFSVIFRTGFVASKTYWPRIITMAFLGFLRCLIQTPMSLVIAEDYPQNFASAFSLFMVVNGVNSLIFGPLTAYVKSATQSDAMVVHVLSVAYMLCVIPWTMELVYMKFWRKK